ncbi:hypothetical protein CBR_g17901 [Chara braunii]|uniref:Fanconi Anaemia group E protein C-terminal domain-containing protein n=1 Tax=Chara braunii TaxID=69332 RepID=A0A388KVU9_CHABU|nr:hypothetical protein CBR_g17901 [Chara braunii]|eukprot:GBG74189.1 hypothetical protein CBR_g17901 [Chara braunii]
MQCGCGALGDELEDVIDRPQLAVLRVRDEENGMMRTTLAKHGIDEYDYPEVGSSKPAKRGKNCQSRVVENEIIRKWSDLLELLEGGGRRTHVSCLQAAVNWAKETSDEKRGTVDRTRKQQNDTYYCRRLEKDDGKRKGAMQDGTGNEAAGRNGTGKFTRHLEEEESNQGQKQCPVLRDFVPELLAREIITPHTPRVGNVSSNTKSCVWLETLPIEMQVSILRFLLVESWRFDAADLQVVAERIISSDRAGANIWVKRAAQSLLEGICQSDSEERRAAAYASGSQSKCIAWYNPRPSSSTCSGLAPFPWLSFGIGEPDEVICPVEKTGEVLEQNTKQRVKDADKSKFDGAVSSHAPAKQKAVDKRDDGDPSCKERRISQSLHTSLPKTAAISPTRRGLSVHDGDSEDMSIDGNDTHEMPPDQAMGVPKSVRKPTEMQMMQCQSQEHEAREVIEDEVPSFVCGQMDDYDRRRRVYGTRADEKEVHKGSLPWTNRSVTRRAKIEHEDHGDGKGVEWEMEEPCAPPTAGDPKDCGRVAAVQATTEAQERKLSRQEGSEASESLFQKAAAVRDQLIGDMPLHGNSPAALDEACALFRHFSKLPEIFGIVEPWNADDDMTLLLCTQCISESDSHAQSSELLKGLLTVKLGRLERSPSRALVSSVLSAARMQPWAVMNAVVAPLIEGTANNNDSKHVNDVCNHHLAETTREGVGMLTIGQCEVINRVVKEAFPKEIVSEFLSQLLDGMACFFHEDSSWSSGGKPRQQAAAAKGGGGRGRGGGGVGGGGGEVSDSVVGLVLTALNLCPAMDVALMDRLVDVLCAAAEGMRRSLKFASTVFSLVTKYGDQLLPHHCDKLRQALSLSSVFLSKSALSRLDALSAA